MTHKKNTFSMVSQGIREKLAEKSFSSTPTSKPNYARSDLDKENINRERESPTT